jgi:hypothetical protein
LLTRLAAIDGRSNNTNSTPTELRANVETVRDLSCAYLHFHTTVPYRKYLTTSCIPPDTHLNNGILWRVMCLCMSMLPSCDDYKH